MPASVRIDPRLGACSALLALALAAPACGPDAPRIMDGGTGSGLGDQSNGDATGDGGSTGSGGAGDGSGDGPAEGSGDGGRGTTGTDGTGTDTGSSEGGDTGPTGDPTALDEHRCAALRMADKRIKTSEVVPGDASRLKPNQETNLGQYIGKSLVIRALIDACGEDSSRYTEADALLREAYLHRFVADADCKNVDNQKGWKHARRTNALRELVFYRDTIADDVYAGIVPYLECQIRGPMNGSSENLRWGQNSAALLAHEILGRTDAPTYAETLAWVKDRLAKRLRDGMGEWGSNYLGGTLKPVLNLAELSNDAEIRELATGLIDLYLGEQAAQSIGIHFAAGRIRTYRESWAPGVPSATVIAQMLFDGPDATYNTEYATDHTSFLVSNWSPPLVVDHLFRSTESYELRHRTVKRSHYFSTSGVWALGAMQNEVDDYWRTTFVTHDVFPIMVQGRDPDVMAVPAGLPIGDTPAPSKIIALRERSFAFENVALIHHGGDTRGVWTGGGVDQVPIRLYYRLGFRPNPVLRGGWAFLQDQDAEVFVAWAPTVGDPRDDGEEKRFGNELHGKYLRSTAERSQGESAVLEVSDAATAGSFAQFQDEILGRNPRPREGAGGVLVYETRSGRTLRFGPGIAEVDGVAQDFTAYPFNASPILQDRTFTAGGLSTSVDPATGALRGDTERVPTSAPFGR